MAKAYEVKCSDCGEQYTYYTDIGFKCPHCGSERRAEFLPGDDSWGHDADDSIKDKDNG